MKKYLKYVLIVAAVGIIGTCISFPIISCNEENKTECDSTLVDTIVGDSLNNSLIDTINVKDLEK